MGSVANVLDWLGDTLKRLGEVKWRLRQQRECWVIVSEGAFTRGLEFRVTSLDAATSSEPHVFWFYDYTD